MGVWELSVNRVKTLGLTWAPGQGCCLVGPRSSYWQNSDGDGTGQLSGFCSLCKEQHMEAIERDFTFSY